jgi:branched-chain amino acid transport system substrate-binding protein
VSFLGRDGNRRLTVASVACLCCALNTPTATARESSSHPKPHFDARWHTTEYVGPGRDLAEPEGLSEVRLAYFGPADEHDADWGDAWRGATLAIDEANAAGGYGGRPFRLLAAWSENPWGSGVSRLARLVLSEGVWAVVGGVDGVTTHLAEQIAVKARILIVSPGNTDLSVNMTNVPWAFTCLPTDDAQAAIVAGAMLDEIGGREYASLATVDHDSRAAHAAYRSCIARRGRRPLLHIDVEPGALHADGVARRLAASHVRAVLILAPARDAARLTRALRAAGFDGSLYGGAPLARRIYMEEAGPAAEGAFVPFLYQPGPEWLRFAKKYESRFGTTADYLAGETYDAVRMTIAAVRKAGLNRARILDALRAFNPNIGVTGAHAWDPTGRNTRPIRLARIRAGRVILSEESRRPGVEEPAGTRTP